MDSKPFIPQDPVVIGKTPDGQPVWMEPKDLIQTPDEVREMQHNQIRAREDDFVLKMANAVLENAGKFVEQTFLKTASQSGTNLFFQDQRKAFEWAVRAGYESIQDGLTTVVKVRGRVVRTMSATIAPQWSEMVARKVMELVRKLPNNA